MCQARSCAASPAANSSAANASLLLNKPLGWCPNAITQAPVSVAISTTALGSKRSAYVSASHKIKRPSASVFSTSMVRPDMLVRISPGLIAPASGMFSHVAIKPTALMPKSSSPMALKVPNTLAAPHISYFISSISAPGLSEIPPVSKVIPLPTNTVGFCDFLPFKCCKTIKRGGSTLPCATPKNEPMPNFSISFCPKTSTLKPYVLASFFACSPK